MKKVSKTPKHKNIKRIATVCAIIVFALLTYTAAAYTNNFWPFFTEGAEVTEQEKTAANSTDEQNARNKEQVNDETSTHVDLHSNPEDIPTAENISISLLSISQNGNVVSYEAQTTGESTGQCSILFTHEVGKPVSRSYETTSGLCGGTVPAIEFDALGEWTVTMRFYADSTQASTTGKVTVE